MDNSGDATASFSGFLYQADIALLKALEKIVEFGNNDEELKKWSLEVEGEEDFTLIEKNNSGKIVSKELYQVKEYEKGTPGKYLDGIIKLYQCTISDRNKNIICKTFICSKVKIEINNDNKSELIKKLKESKNQDLLFQKCFCKLGIQELENKVKEYNKAVGSKKSKSIIKDYFSKNKNEEKKEEVIEAFKNIDLTDFETNFDVGEINGFGNFKVVQEKIVDLIKTLKPGIITPDNYFKFLESKIKRKIQENKGNKNRDKITFLEIKEEINKKELILSNIDYQDIFINTFIKLFDKNFLEIYSDGDGCEGFLKEICKELPENDYDLFLDNIRNVFSKEIFEVSKSNKKVLGFIQYTIGNEEVENIFDKNDFDSLQILLNKVSFLNDRIEKIILLLIGYFYSKMNNTNLKDNFFYGEDNFLEIEEGIEKHGILTGLGDLIKHIKEFLKSNIFYRYEKTHIGIYGVDEYLYKHLGENKEEEGFIESLEESDKENYEKIKKWGISKTKEIKIFSGKNCLKEEGDRNAKYFMN